MRFENWSPTSPSRSRSRSASAPKSYAAFTALLPLRLRLIHAWWSGECGWASLGDTGPCIALENATRYPQPGQVLLYTGEISEPEILAPYGNADFASKAGPLAGGHVVTITDEGNLLPQIGRALLWRGSLPIIFERELNANAQGRSL